MARPLLFLALATASPSLSRAGHLVTRSPSLSRAGHGDPASGEFECGNFNNNNPGRSYLIYPSYANCNEYADRIDNAIGENTNFHCVRHLTWCMCPPPSTTMHAMIVIAACCCCFTLNLSLLPTKPPACRAQPRNPHHAPTPCCQPGCLTLTAAAAPHPLHVASMSQPPPPPHTPDRSHRIAQTVSTVSNR